jgi:hypothetical protein
VDEALRRMAIGAFLGSFSGEYIPRAIRAAAAAGEDPAEAAWRVSSGWGSLDDRMRVCATRRGLEVRPGGLHGRPELIPWREVAEAALGRSKPRQLALF